MNTVYDQSRKCLVCYDKVASSEYWDNHWNDSKILKSYKSMNKHNYFCRLTRKYLSLESGPILEGGCGIGQFVDLFTRIGYHCIGIDTAANTIDKISKLSPDLDFSLMDVTQLDFPEDHFAGYWSFGVIEHFYNGYDGVLNEMQRVVKPGGYVFITVPTLSILRKLKIKLGCYKKLANAPDTHNDAMFYQFILPPGKVIDDFKAKNFKVRCIHKTGGLTGLKNDISLLRKPLEYFLSIRQKHLIFKVAYRVLDAVLSPIAGRTCIFVFQK